MEKIDFHLAQRRKVAAWYNQHLAGLREDIVLPVEEAWAHHSCWIYTILLKHGNESERDQFMAALAKDGIETRPVFYPMHVLPPYREPKGSYPVAESLARRGISLPTHGLLTEEDIAYIAASIRRVRLARHAVAAGRI
jgi:perosamine synthetase